MPAAPLFPAGHPVPAPAPQPHFTREEVKARAKAIKKQRKHDSRRLLLGLCASLHALGFSF